MKQSKWIVVFFILLAPISGCANTHKNNNDALLEPSLNIFKTVNKHHIKRPEIKELIINTIFTLEQKIEANNYNVNKFEVDWVKQTTDEHYIRIYKDVFIYYMNNIEGDVNSILFTSINKTLKKLDNQSFYLTPKQYRELLYGYSGAAIGVGVKSKEGFIFIGKIIDNSPAFISGLKMGDRIIHINDTSISEHNKDTVVKLLRGPIDSYVKVTVARKDKKKLLTFNIKRGKLKTDTIRHEWYSPGFLYVGIDRFTKSNWKKLASIINKTNEKNIKSLILDLRGNTGGTLNSAANISNMFLKSGRILTLKGSDDDDEIRFDAVSKNTQPDYPMIILVDENTAAASEIVTGVLKYYKRALILGAETAGSWNVQKYFQLPDKSAVKLTTHNILIADSINVLAEGVNPHIELISEKSNTADLTLKLAKSLLRSSQGHNSEVAINIMIDLYHKKTKKP